MNLPLSGDPLFQPWRGAAEALLADAEQRDLQPRWVLRGRHMRTKSALMAAWAAAVPFPPTFGATWDSLRDALADLPEGGTFLVLEAGLLLQEEPPEAFQTLLTVLRQVREDLAGRPFRLVLQAEGEGYDTLVAGLRASGALGIG